MEEKVKLSNLMNVDSAGSLHRKYQELLKAMQGKDELISELEAQLEKQVSTRALCSSWSSCPRPLSRAPLLRPLVAGAPLPHQAVHPHGDVIIGRGMRSQAGDVVGNGIGG